MGTNEMKHSGILYITKMSFIFDLPEKMAKNVKKKYSTFTTSEKKERKKKPWLYTVINVVPEIGFKLCKFDIFDVQHEADCTFLFIYLFYRHCECRLF